MREQGTVVLLIHISPAGSPQGVDVQQSSGFKRLDDAARDAVQRWRFLPGGQGRPAESRST